MCVSERLREKKCMCMRTFACLLDSCMIIMVLYEDMSHRFTALNVKSNSFLMHFHEKRTLCLCIIPTLLSPYYSIDLLASWEFPSGLSASLTMHTGRSTRPARAAGSEIITPAVSSLVPPDGHSLTPHRRPIHPWPPLPASFAKYSFCCVQVVAGGGGGVVRSSYSQKGWSIKRGNTITGSICTQRDGSLWSPRLHLPR